MKKTKRMMAAIMAAGMMTGSQCLTASAAYNIPIKDSYEFDHFYSYNELAEMTDDELTEMFDIPEFNNDTIPEEEKFRLFFNKKPQNFIGDYMSDTYSAYLLYKSGNTIPYLTFYADTEQPLDPSFDPSQFGYPSDWTVELVDEIDGTPDGNGHRFYCYHVLIPAEIMTDFESCIRVFESEHYASNSVRDKSGLYGVTSFAGTAAQHASWGESVMRKRQMSLTKNLFSVSTIPLQHIHFRLRSCPKDSTPSSPKDRTALPMFIIFTRTEI